MPCAVRTRRREDDADGDRTGGPRPGRQPRYYVETKDELVAGVIAAHASEIQSTLVSPDDAHRTIRHWTWLARLGDQVAVVCRTNRSRKSSSQPGVTGPFPVGKTGGIATPPHHGHPQMCSSAADTPAAASRRTMATRTPSRSPPAIFRWSPVPLTWRSSSRRRPEPSRQGLDRLTRSRHDKCADQETRGERTSQ